MVKNKWLWIGIISIFILGIGGKFYMDYKAKEQAELEELQWDLANYIYNNYRLYTVDEEKFDELDKEFNGGNGSLTTTEFKEKYKAMRIFEEINHIQFIDFKKGPMGGLEVYFIINGIYSDETTLDTKSFETDEWIYRIDSLNDRSLEESKSYFLEERETSLNETISDSKIEYYAEVDKR